MKNDIDLYNRHAHEWWDMRSPFAASLHALNAIRVEEIRQRLGADFIGVAVDLGCGGGLLSEALSRLGGIVVGIDLSAASLHEAVRHGRGCQALSYACANVLATPLPDGCADVVVCADVLEHIPDWTGVVAQAARLLRPGGCFYVNTISRTWRARAVTIWLGEGLGFVPKGTHDARLFVRPDELAAEATRHGLIFETAVGQRALLLKTLFTWRLALTPCRGTWATYSAWMRKDRNGPMKPG